MLSQSAELQLRCCRPCTTTPSQPPPNQTQNNAWIAGISPQSQSGPGTKLKWRAVFTQRDSNTQIFPVSGIFASRICFTIGHHISEIVEVKIHNVYHHGGFQGPREDGEAGPVRNPLTGGDPQDERHRGRDPLPRDLRGGAA